MKDIFFILLQTVNKVHTCVLYPSLFVRANLDGTLTFTKLLNQPMILVALSL